VVEDEAAWTTVVVEDEAAPRTWDLRDEEEDEATT
jgi:hypothetical protein